MPTANLTLILLSVMMICVGQLLFKLVGLRLQAGISALDIRVAGFGILAMAIYAAATLIWIYVLRTTPLTKAYPYMAISFVIVPVASIWLYSEQVRPQYVAGAALIVLGVILIGSSK